MTRTPRPRPTLPALLAALSTLLLGSGSALAVPAHVDFNDFELGSPSGQLGGTGFESTSPWGGSGRVFVVEGDLSSPKYQLSQSGNGRSIQGDFNAPRHTNRELATPLSGTVWFSFLLNLPDSTSRGGIVFNPTSSNGTGNPYSVFLLGPETLRSTVGQSSGFNIDASVQTTVGETVLVVGQIDTNTQSLKAWLDPDLVASPDILSHTPHIDTFLLGPDQGVATLDAITKVGAMSWNTAGSNALGGKIDNIRVSNTVSAFLDIPTQLVLSINRDTGQMTLKSNADNVQLAGYTISSENGTLQPGNWRSIADFYDADAPAPGGRTVDPSGTWSKLGTPNTMELVESALFTQGATLSMGQTIDLGTGLWRRSPFEDIGVEILLGDGTVAQDVAIEWIGNNDTPYAFGDFDLDGDVDIDDFRNGFLPHYATNTSGMGVVDQYFAGDLDGDGETGFYDFLVFNNLYQEANPGTAALTLHAAVPEPATLSLLAVVGLAVALRRVRSASLCLLLVAMLSLSSPATAQSNYLVNGDFENTTDWLFAGAGPGTQPFGWRDTTGDNPATQQFDAQAIGGTGVSALMTPVANARIRQFLTTPTRSQFNLSFDFASDDPGADNDRSLSTSILSQTQAVIMTFRVVDEDDNGIGELQFFSGEWEVGTFPNSVIFSDVMNSPLAHSVEIRVDTAFGAPTYDVKLTNSGGQVFEANGLTYFNSTPRLHDQAGGLEFLTSNSNGSYLLDNIRLTDGISQRGLSLYVLESTGEAFLANSSDAPITIDAYRILSDSGALQGGNWTSLESTGFDGSPENPVWTELQNTSFELAEGFVGAGTEIGVGRGVSLGQIYNTFDTSRDLQLEFHLAGAPAIGVLGPVNFVAGLPGDYNNDGTVDALDYVVWRNNLDAPAGTLPNDINGGTIGSSQYLTWKAFYGASLSGGALVSTSPVPEPSTGLLLLGLGAAASAVILRK